MDAQLVRHRLFGHRLLGVLLALSACSKTTEELACNPDTVLLQVECAEELGTVEGQVNLVGLDGQTASRTFQISCPGRYNLQAAITGYAAGSSISAHLEAQASGKALLPNEPVSVTLEPGCTKKTITLAVMDGGMDAAVPVEEEDALPSDGANDEDGAVVDPNAADLSRGQACQRDDQCTDGHCVDGVCCESACEGTCRACSSEKTGENDGTCAVAKTGVPDDRCTATAAEECGLNGTCNGAGECAQWDSTHECKPARCENNSFIPAQKCTGSGQCQDPSPNQCGEYACTSEKCKTECQTAADCSPGVQCINKKCGGKRALGERCTSNSECTSPGFCVDGVCCGSACSGTCEACSNMLSGGNDGECIPVPASKGAQSDCEVQSGCGRTGLCDGARKCQLQPASTECGTRMCSGGLYSPPRRCDGSGSCVTSATTDCAGYECGPSECKTSCSVASDCVSSHFCSGNKCTPKKAQGVGCQTGVECSLGNCVEGVCCDSACGSAAQTCLTGGQCRARFSRQTYVKASNTTPSKEGSFGEAVAVSGDTFVVGDPKEGSPSKVVNGDQTQSSDQVGAVYVFTRSPTSWAQQAYLKSSQASAGALFGSSVAIQGDTVAVGSPGTNQVYVYTRSGATWAERAALSPDFQGKQAGGSVSLSGDMIVAGDLGNNRVHVFRKTFDTWRYDQSILAPEASSTVQFGGFGKAVALLGDNLLVGAPSTASVSGGISRLLSGAVVWYQRNASNVWERKATIRESDPEPNSLFGTSVYLGLTRLAIGAVDNGSPLMRGAVHFGRNLGGAWTLTQELLPPSGRLFEALGSGIALAVSEQILASTARSSGLLYLFLRTDETFSDIGQISAQGAPEDEGFSAAIAGTESYLVVGAIGDRGAGKGVSPPRSSGANVTGAVYVLE